MAYENEDCDIEQHLVAKITHAINHLGDQQNLVSKLYSPKDEFTSLLNILQIKENLNFKGDWHSVRRSNLYSLNNLVTEWQIITKNQSALSAKEVCKPSDNIKKRLGKMKKEVSGEDGEIEQHLVAKITHAINHLDEQQNLGTKLYSPKDEFKSLLNKLQRKENPEFKGHWHSVRRNNLNSLNNLVIEWQIITKTQSALSAKEGCEPYDDIKKRLEEMKKEVSGEESSSRGTEHGDQYHTQPNPPVFERNKDDQLYRSSSRHAPRKVHGLEHKVLAMVRELVLRNVNAPFKVFGVVGAAGMGKTTLCQAFFGEDSVKKHYSPKIWVCLSKQPRGKSDYKQDIVVRILESLGIDDEVIETAVSDHHYGLKRLIFLLRRQLVGKRYLIVLDDAWNDDEKDVEFFSKLNKNDHLDVKYDELSYGFPKGYGGTVISSSTSEALLKKMLGKDVGLQHLDPQPDAIIYEIFKDTVIGYDEDEREFPQYLEDLKGEWLKKCDGVPLAAKLLAKIARQQLKIKPKPQPPPPPATAAAAGGHDVKLAPASGVERLTGGDGGVDGGHKGGVVPKLKHEDDMALVD